MPKITHKGKSYDYVITSQNLFTAEVHFDSHGPTIFTRRNGSWSVNNATHLPDNTSISEIGKLLEKEEEK